MDTKNSNKPIQCVIKHHLVTIRTNNSGWTRELNVVSWEGGPAKLDIRDWSRDKSRSGKGLTFSRKETERLRNMLSIINLDIIEDDNAQVQNVSATYEQPLAQKEQPVPEAAQAESENTESKTVDFPGNAEINDTVEVTDDLKEAV